MLSHVEGADRPSPYTQMVDLYGKQLHHACCPLDPAFMEMASKRLCDYAELGADIILLHDDFRLSIHGGDLSCGCPHLLSGPLLTPVIPLGEEYASLESFGCKATLDGKRIRIESPVYGFSSAFFKLKK